MNLLNDREVSIATLEPVALSIALVQRSLTLDASGLEGMCSLAASLHHVEPRALDERGRLAFWLNVYNTLNRHALVRENLSGNLLAKFGFFSRSAYRVGALEYTMDAIEHGLLRGNRRRPLSPFKPLREDDPRLLCAPSAADARVHFALNCGARSCPAVRPYRADTVDALLDEGTRAYFAQECAIDEDERALRLPFLLRMYRMDFGDERAMVDFALAHLDAPRAQWLRAHRDRVKVRFGAYDWTIVR